MDLRMLLRIFGGVNRPGTYGLFIFIDLSLTNKTESVSLLHTI